METKIALAGNPNSGKTTVFNILTGSKQYVGNWPGVTVEKKEGRLRGFDNVLIQDLPGIYSLSPYSLEEVIARNYIINERPDVILNIVDASNIERNLYLTVQLLEIGLPVVAALNMMDVVRKNGDFINTARLSEMLGCEIIETAAIRGEGLMTAARRAAELAGTEKTPVPRHRFSDPVEQAVTRIGEIISGTVDPQYLRWFAIKLFERDEKGKNWDLMRTFRQGLKTSSGIANRNLTTTRKASSQTNAMNLSAG